MKRRKLLSLIGMSPALLAGSTAEAGRDKHKKDAPAPEAKVIALSPKGAPPPVQRYSMAPRLNTVEGKTIYLVDTGFFGADLVLQQVADWFQQNMPSVKTVSRKKAGTYPEDDPKLWAEIKANGNATIMAIGH
ncbi:MAG TPA: hypothetical protein VMB02_00315 [Candidatus Aquilonibacter sp.]|nr:hypothetical protein [Candidatus Aquilonibacter sp.]